MKNELDDNAKKEFLIKVMERLSHIDHDDTAPYLSYCFEKMYEEHFQKSLSLNHVKHEFNQLVLDQEKNLTDFINDASDPLKRSIQCVQIGNYIDFGAMKHVSKQRFLELFKQQLTPLNEDVYKSFLNDCKKAKRFLLIADNCGEIVLDRFFLEILSKQFPHLKMQVMVKQQEISNDATLEDALQARINKIADICTTENGIAGCDLKHIGPNALNAVENADVILAKGQANFETLYGCNKNVYYAFLCKCNHFANLFQVEPLTPIFMKDSSRIPLK